MAIATVPAFPLRSQGLTQAAYSSGVEASLTAIPTFISDLNAVGSAYALTTNGTSVSSVLIGTGAKTFTTQLNLGYLVGMALRIANSSANYMTGDVTSYAVGTGVLVMNITSVVGSGTLASWTITMAAVGANAAGSVSFTPAGNIAATNVQSAIQELDTEKLSSAAGAVTGANLEDIIAGSTVGTIANIPVITYDANGRITSVANSEKITLNTPIATTSGTSHDFTAIPSNVKRITISFVGVSTNSTSIIMVQIGDGGGIKNTGYLGAATSINGASTINQTTGFGTSATAAAAHVYHGTMVLTLENSTNNTWTFSSILARSEAAETCVGAGSKSLSATLDRVRITTVTGTPTFDAGEINITYE